MNEVAARIVSFLGRNTLEVSFLISLILLVRLFMKDRLSARWQYALWFLVCIKILIPWTPYSEISLMQLVPDALTHTKAPSLMPSISPQDIHEPCASTIPWGTWIALSLWITGMVSLGLYLLKDYQTLNRFVSRCPTLTNKNAHGLLDECRSHLHIRKTVQLVITDAVKSPALLGVFQPKLLLPQSMAHTFTKRQLRHVFLHELAHLKRLDIPASCLASVCHAIHWFNPLVWYAFQQMRTDRELACDQMALTELNTKEESTLYGQTIIRILEFNRCHPLRTALAGMGQTRHQVRKRIVSIAQFEPDYPGIQWGAACLLACLAVTGLTRTTTPSNPTASSPALAVAQLTCETELPVTSEDKKKTDIQTPSNIIAPSPSRPEVAQKTRLNTQSNMPPKQQTPRPQTQSTPFMDAQAQAQTQTSQDQITAMNTQMWVQAQLNAIQIQQAQNRYIQQMYLQQQARRQQALQSRRTYRRRPTSTMRRRRRTSNGIPGIIQMAAIQTSNNRTK